MSIFLRILLYILLLILTIFIFALICPITYKLHLEKDKRPFLLSVKANYLLGLVHFVYQYPGEEGIKLRIFGFPLLKKKTKQETKQETKKVEPLNKERGKEKKEDSSDSQTEVDINQTGGALEASLASQDDKKEEQQQTENSDNKKQSASSDINQHVKGADKKQESIGSKWEHIKKEYTFYRKLLDAEFTREFLKDAFQRLLHILGCILPKKLRGWIRFGASTPDITGLAMAGYGMLFCNRRCLKNFTFEADFENQVLEGEVWIKGSVCPISLLWQAMRIIFDKKLGKIRKVLKKHKNKNRKV